MAVFLELCVCDGGGEIKLAGEISVGSQKT